MSVVDYNVAEYRQGLIEASAFGAPLAQDVNFKLTSRATYDYNCIAFAMGVDDRWVDCADLPWHWWPQQKKVCIDGYEDHLILFKGHIRLANHGNEVVLQPDGRVKVVV